MQSGSIIQKGEPHERNPCAPKFEEITPEETSRQADCTSKVAWNLAKNMQAQSRTLNYVLFSCEGARDTEHRMFVMDSGASMHNAERGHKRLTATGDSANKRVSTSFVHDLYLFVTVQLLDETPVILLLHKLCPKRGDSCEWTSAKLHK